MFMLRVLCVSAFQVASLCDRTGGDMGQWPGGGQDNERLAGLAKRLGQTERRYGNAEARRNAESSGWELRRYRRDDLRRGHTQGRKTVSIGGKAATFMLGGVCGSAGYWRLSMSNRVQSWASVVGRLSEVLGALSEDGAGCGVCAAGRWARSGSLTIR